MVYLLVALAIFGHWALCIYVINRLHSTALPPWLIKCIDLLWYVMLFILPVVVLLVLLGPTPAWWTSRPWARLATLAYAGLCYVSLPAVIPVWIRHIRQSKITQRLESNEATVVDVERHLGRLPSGSIATTVAARLPWNDVFQLSVHRKVIRLPRLPANLDGLTIAHLSDLHFTGRVTRPYYDLVVDQANQLDADLMVISGDIIDKRKCFGWLSEVLGRLRAREGVFFVLGNHDLRIHDEVGLRNELVKSGLVDLGGRFEMREIRGYPVAIAGNELPWFQPAANMRQIPTEHPAGRPFRIAVSHSPDQIEWARRNDVDLMLAGHTHGGQIRLPVIGPIFSPSAYGVRYASGTFFEDPTLLHVSRGLSGTRPLRLNCPPELALLTLRGDR
jgi:predicted MPP superfamily phosphohydrolase